MNFAPTIVLYKCKIVFLDDNFIILNFLYPQISKTINIFAIELK